MNSNETQKSYCKIPVLYTTFNRVEYTKKSLPALVKNSPGSKIYIFDNNSSDGTQEYLKDFSEGRSNIELFLSETNEGVSGPMNKFFSLTEGSKWVAKVDNDTVVPRGWLTKMIKAADETDIDFMQAKHHFIISKFADWDAFAAGNSSVKVSNGNIIPYRFVGGSGIIIRRDKVSEVPFDQYLFGWSKFQLANEELKKGFFDGVFVELLDMETYNKHKKDVDKDYYSKTGRKVDNAN